MIYLTICVFTFFYAVIQFFFIQDEGPVFGVYHRRSKWFIFKYVLFVVVFYAVKYTRALLRLCRWTDEEKPKNYDRPLELGSDIKLLCLACHQFPPISTNTSNDLYRVLCEQQLSPQTYSDMGISLFSHPFAVQPPELLSAFDGVLFTGGNSEGYFFTVTAERCHRKVMNGYFYLLVPTKGLLCSPKLPDTILFDSEDDNFGAEGISISHLSNKQKWIVSYRGAMWQYPERSKQFRVKFTAQWTSTYPCFNCLDDIHPLTIAKMIASEGWSEKFFQNMRNCRYVELQHYQMGSAKVELVINGDNHNFHTMSFRGRLYGSKRGLSSIHRSASFHIFLDDGVTAVISAVSQPSTISMGVIGYVQKTDGSLSHVDWCDFLLYQNGECGRPPVDHGFQFRAGGILYTIQIKILYEYMHYIGWNWELKVIERFFKCMVNGVLGQGISEFHYRNKTGRPEELNNKDPAWFQVYRPHYIYS